MARVSRVRREERVQQLKDCGRFLIEKAETLCGEYLSQESLRIVIELGGSSQPKMTVERNIVPDTFIERMMSS